MHDLIRLHRSALRSGDRPLAAALARVLRSDHPLREEADRMLRAMARAPARWSAPADAVIERVMERLGSAPR